MQRAVLGRATCAATASAQRSPEQKVDLRFAYLNRAPAPDVSISLVRDGKIILAKGYGMASLEHDI